MNRPFWFLLLLGFSAAVAAQVMYVDDKLLVGLRSAQSGGRTIATLETGTRLEVIETVGDSVHVRDPKGNEGWVRTQYLATQPVARDRLTQAELKIAALEADKQKLRDQLAGTEGDRNEAKKGRAQLEKENLRLEKELAELRESAANPLKLSNENKVMRERLTTLEAETQRIGAENDRLHTDTNRQWFMTGAGVLLGGVLLGLILPKLRRRRSSWSSDF